MNVSNEQSALLDTGSWSSVVGMLVTILETKLDGRRELAEVGGSGRHVWW